MKVLDNIYWDRFNAIEENKERLVRNNQIIRDNVVDIVSDKIDSNNEIEQKLNTLQDLIEKQMSVSVKDEQQKYD